MRHRANPRFWRCYRQLPEEIQRLADENYRLLLQDPRHPSLRFKKIGRFWSVRVGLHYRALAVEHGAEVVWFWVGPHADYNRLEGYLRPSHTRPKDHHGPRPWDSITPRAAERGRQPVS